MKTMEMHETEAVVAPDGTVSVHDLPLAAGERVRVIVVAEKGPRGRRHTPEEIARSAGVRRGLQGTVVQYIDPTEPVGVEDWDALDDLKGAD